MTTTQGTAARNLDKQITKPKGTQIRNERDQICEIQTVWTREYYASRKRRRVVVEGVSSHVTNGGAEEYYDGIAKLEPKQREWKKH